MLDKKFILKIPKPSFDSSLTSLIMELDKLHNKRLRGSTHPRVFFQLKHIFHMMESIGSARIEGNNTTIAEYIETKLEEKTKTSPSILEIKNIENTMTFIEEHIKDCKIDRIFISEIHKKVVEGLEPPPKGEGDITPGIYRKNNVKIAKSIHTPPDYINVQDYMDELFVFINSKYERKYDLLNIAIAHHRFVWVHPFTNGNGRTVRLLTYAMLVKLGFNVEIGRILNPTAIFCSSRNDYYNYLSKADTYTDEGILSWCEYVLQGLKDEIEKIDKLLNYEFLRKHILLPAIDISLERSYITDIESKILKRVTDKQIIQSQDLKDIFKDKAGSEISRQIRRLIDKKMLQPAQTNTRKYVIRFDNNYLLRAVIITLSENGFLPDNEKL
jgi:Fic family protein